MSLFNEPPTCGAQGTCVTSPTCGVLRCLAVGMLLGHMAVLAGCGREVDGVSQGVTEDPKDLEESGDSSEGQAAERYRFVETWRSGSKDEALNQFVELWAVVEGEVPSVNFISPLSEAEFVALAEAEREAVQLGFTERGSVLVAVIRASFARAEEKMSNGDDTEAERILIAVRNLAVVLNSPDALLFSRRIGRATESKALSQLVELYSGMPDRQHRVESLQQRLEELSSERPPP